MTPRVRLAVIAAALVLTGALAGEEHPGTPATASAASRTAPLVEQLVVWPSGRSRTARVRASATSAKIGRSRCAVGAGTPLAALLRARPARVALRDYGSCSRRARDAGGLFVTSIGGDRNRGQDGWVYKVNGRLATAGAGDPRGPFGRGALRRGSRVLWFYCRTAGAARGCQETLTLTTAVEGPEVVVRVRAQDDFARTRPAAGASVRVGALQATADAAGVARLTLGPGRHAVTAAASGLIRPFPEHVIVR